MQRKIRKGDKDIFKRLEEYLRRYPVLFAYVYGSFAEGNRGRLSDIDLAVCFNQDLSRSERFDLRLRLSSEISGICATAVDVVSLNDASLSLAFEIIKKGKVLFCKDRDVFVEKEYQVMKRYLDRRYYDLRRTEMVLERIHREGLLK